MKLKWSPTDHVGLPPCVKRRLAAQNHPGHHEYERQLPLFRQRINEHAEPDRLDIALRWAAHWKAQAMEVNGARLDTLRSLRADLTLLNEHYAQSVRDKERLHTVVEGLRGDLALLNQHHDAALKENERLASRVNGMAWVIYDLRRDSHGSVIGVYLDQNAALAMRGVWQSDHPDAPCPTIIGYGLKG